MIEDRGASDFANKTQETVHIMQDTGFPVFRVSIVFHLLQSFFAIFKVFLYQQKIPNIISVFLCIFSEVRVIAKGKRARDHRENTMLLTKALVMHRTY